MNRPLTHKDRGLIWDSLSSIPLDPDETDDSLIRSVSAYLMKHPSSTGTERSYHHYTIDLINFLRQAPEDGKSDLVRRALRFLQLSDVSNPLLTTPAVKVFVTSFVLHEVSDNGNLLLSDELRGLSEDEKQFAEEILLNHADQTLDEDSDLLNYSSCFLADLPGNGSVQMVMRFRRNINRLVKVLSAGQERSDEQKAWARGALNYIRINEDAIPDDLGIIGLLDDMYIANTAVRLIDPDIQPWEDVISDLYTLWPFLRDMVLTYAGSEYTYSDFALINTALACRDLTKQGETSRAALILPASGVTPFLVAFGAALSVAYDAARKTDATPVFEQGDKVWVDGDAVAVYVGIEEMKGQKFIKLKQTTKSKKHSGPCFFVSLAELPRLSKAPGNVKTKGNITTFLKNSDAPLNATEQIFHLPFPLQFTESLSRVWLVSKVAGAKVLASEIQILGHPLSSVLPMGSIRRDGEFVPWSSNFEETEGILTVIPDMDLAAEILEEQDLSAEDLILIDLGGANRNKSAALNLIQSLNARVLCVAEEKDAEVIASLEESHFSLWEWSEPEIKEMVSNGTHVSAVNQHPFRQNDLRICKSLTLKPEVKVLRNENAENARQAIDGLNEYVRKQGDEVSGELEELLAKLLEVLFFLIRSPAPLEYLPGSVDRMIGILGQLQENAESSLYLSDSEKTLVSQPVESLEYFALELADRNPKTDAIKKVLRNDSRAKIAVVPHIHTLLTDTRQFGLEPDIFLPWPKLHSAEPASLIIPYWPGKKKVWEMISDPPPGKVYFILYSFEDEWRAIFDEFRNNSRTIRMDHNPRSDVFTGISRWPRHKVQKSGDDIQKVPQHKPALTEGRTNRVRQRLTHAVTEEGESADTEARLVKFTGGAHAFFARGHMIPSVTHLLSDLNESEDTGKVISVPVNGISEGDVLVFSRGTDRDAIRELAETNLPSETRELAGLWQRVLRTYADSRRLPDVNLQRLLRNAGCRRHIATVRNWLESETIIGPRHYNKGDLDAIARVTGDEEFIRKQDECEKAIAQVWGEHLRAAHVIATRIRSGIGDRITKDPDLHSPLDIGDGLVLAQVEFIDSDSATVPHAVVNRLRMHS